MKINIFNKNPFPRSIPTPAGNVGIPIGGNESVTIDFPAAFREFFESMRNYDYLVDFDETEDDQVPAQEVSNVPDTQNSNETPVTSEVPAPQNTEEVKSDPEAPKTEESAPETPAPETPAPEAKSEEPSVEENKEPETKAAEESAPEAKSEEEELTADKVVEILKGLEFEQVAKLCDHLNIAVGNVKKVETLVGKLDGVSDEDLVKAYKEVIANA